MADKTKNEGFTAEEKAAMKEHAKELKASASKAESLAYMLEKIEELSEPDRSFARKIHEIVTTVAPQLAAKTWYGMPNYNNEDGKSIVFFQPAEKFKARYATLGFNDTALLDDGDMWPVAYAITQIGAAEEKLIAALVKKAAGQ
jgi:uncharacterized protein YdhG (YjbR/CyaY superfamily)